MNKYKEAARLLSLVQKAGARHSARDNDLVQQMHDRACDLGAKCNCGTPTHPMLKAMVYRHPGHPNQKVHGNRFGGFSTTKESLRRLKGDKEARQKYKETARKRAGAEAGKLRNSMEYGAYKEQLEGGQTTLQDLKRISFFGGKDAQVYDLLEKDVQSGAIVPKPPKKKRQSQPKSKNRQPKGDVDMSTAQAAIRAAGGDKQAAWSRYIQLNYQKTGSLSPGIDAKDFFKAVGR